MSMVNQERREFTHQNSKDILSYQNNKNNLTQSRNFNIALKFIFFF